MKNSYLQARKHFNYGFICKRDSCQYGYDHDRHGSKTKSNRQNTKTFTNDLTTEIFNMSPLLFAIMRDEFSWDTIKKHNSWQIPSGKVDKGESLYDTLCREMDEELGVLVHEATILGTSKKIFFAMSREGHFYETTIQGTFASKEKETMEEFKRMHFIKTQTPLGRGLTDGQNELTNPEELLINRHMFAELRQMTTYPERKTLMKNPVHIPDAIDTNRQYIQYRNTETKSLHIDLYEKSFFAS